jgi:hypothetical protein
VLRQAWIGILGLLLLVGCGGEQSAMNSGPVLISEATLGVTTPLPTRVLSPTPSPVSLVVITSTVDPALPTRSNLQLSTPTLPPSKTPSVTPSLTATFTEAPRSSATPNVIYVLITATPGIPAQGVLPLPTAGVSYPVSVGSCPAQWFFSRFVPPNCPLSPAVASAGSLQSFQNGFMLWIGTQDAIYVLYNDSVAPRWQVYNDAFQEGMPETDPNFSAPGGLFQPRRGFGYLWRTQQNVRDRLGWGTAPTEIGYTVQAQIGADGVIYLSEPNGAVYGLSADGNTWLLY